MLNELENAYQVWQFGVGGWRDTTKQEYDDTHPGYRQIVGRAVVAQPADGAGQAGQVASLGKDPEFLRLLNAQQATELACHDDSSDVKRDAANDAWDALIGYLDRRTAPTERAAAPAEQASAQVKP